MTTRALSGHHAWVIEASEEEGLQRASTWVETELDMHVLNNPDVVIQRYGLLTVADARTVGDMAAGAPFGNGAKVVIVAASRAYHEAQNALLKLFEEPPPHTYLFLIVPTLGGLLPTLRSRVQVLTRGAGGRSSEQGITKSAEDFLGAAKEKRSAQIAKLASGRDDDERRAHREEAIALMNGIESQLVTLGIENHATTLAEIATLRGYLYDRSAPVKMILEHLSLVIEKEQ